MPLQVHDLAATHAAWAASLLALDVRTNLVQSLIYKGKPLADAQAAYVRMFRRLLDQPKKYVLLRATDENGTDIAWAQWERVEVRSGPEQREDRPRDAGREAGGAGLGGEGGEGLGSDAHSVAGSAVASNGPSDAWAEFGRRWSEADERSRREMLKGRESYWLLCNIATHPDFRRRGAGSALTRWPFEQADNANVPCILHVDADGLGLAVYRKLGFEEAGSFDVDLRPVGGERVMTFLCMIREPAGGP